MSQAPPRSEAELLAEAIDAFRAGDTPTRAIRSLSDVSRQGQTTLSGAWSTLDHAVRRRITRQMGKLARERIELTFGRALRVALDDAAADVRRLAIGALWDDEGDDLIDRLLQVSTTDPSPETRAEAVGVLGGFAKRAAVEEMDEEISERLRGSLLSTVADPGEAAEVRRSALIAVAAFGGAEIRDLIHRYDAADDASDSIAAMMAMGRTVESAWLSTLIPELDSDDAEVRQEAARSLGEIGDPRAIEELASACTDREPGVRSAAIEALGQIGGPGAAKALRNLEEDADESDLEQIRHALADATGEVLTL